MASTCRWREARISPLDRGFLYADGVYEVMPVYGGRPFRFAAHQTRLARSLEGIRMEDPHSVRGVARDPGHADRAQRRRRPVRVLAGHARRRTRAQPRPAAAGAAHGIRLLRAVTGQLRSHPRAGRQLRDRAGHALGALRHQVDLAAGERAAAPAGSRCRRRRDHPAARGRADGGLCVRGARGARWRGPHAAELAPYPARHHARGGGGDGRALRHRPTASPRSARRSCAPRRRCGSRPPRASCRRSPRSTGTRSAAGARARLWRRVYAELQRYKQELAGTPW